MDNNEMYSPPAVQEAIDDAIAARDALARLKTNVVEKPFLVFSGTDYDAYGGWKDFCSAHATLEAAKAALLGKDKGEWGHIVDVRIGQIVAKGRLIQPTDVDEYWRRIHEPKQFGFIDEVG